jgi:hypothetical protein
MKTYRGYRLLGLNLDNVPVTGACIVKVHSGPAERDLPMRLDIRQHSPTGFEWGYGGSGPAQLALALVADACGDHFAVPSIYQILKRSVVAQLASDGWSLTAIEVQSWVQDILTARAERTGVSVDELVKAITEDRSAD